MKRIHAIIHGQVQGVNFRASTLREARRLGVTGWVRNTPHATVEVIAEGAQEPLEALVTFLHHGPPAARVDSVDMRWQEASGDYTDFSITA